MVFKVLVVLFFYSYIYIYFILGALISSKNRNLLSTNMEIFRIWFTAI